MVDVPVPEIRELIKPCGLSPQKSKAISGLSRILLDEHGVTAAFNRNILRNTNRIAGTDFAPGEWAHVARFDEQESRIEMHLEATVDVAVRWEGGERRFAAGDRIHTENSYKYTLESFGALLHDAGMQTVDAWTDPRRFFAVFVGFVPVNPCFNIANLRAMFM